jgi:hypothetical protein
MAKHLKRWRIAFLPIGAALFLIGWVPYFAGPKKPKTKNCPKANNKQNSGMQFSIIISPEKVVI